MVPTSVDPAARASLDDLRDHDREVLEFLSQDPSTQVAFQGLRRRLGIHPEQLSRALHRLAQDELVERTELGYRVSRRALGILSPSSLPPAEPTVTILQTSLPAHVDLRGLVGALRGTWIGPLRWYGLAESDEGLRLGWALEDDSIGIEILVRPGQLTMNAKVDAPSRLDEATRLGYELFHHVSREISSNGLPTVPVIDSLPTVARAAAPLPGGFQESIALSGLTEPTAVRFASDGRVFVAEKSGIIKVFDNLTAPSPTIFADLRTNTHNFWDRGLLGLALDPNFPVQPWVYALYTHDAAIGGTAPRWGKPGVSSDPCPTPPGPTTNGCVVSGRLSRLQAAGNVMTGPEQVLIEDWCQQYPSHSIGDLASGPARMSCGLATSAGTPGKRSIDS